MSDIEKGAMGWRTFGVGVDYSPTSNSAIMWVAQHVAKAGDKIILIHVQTTKNPSSDKILWEGTGAPMVTLNEFIDMSVLVRYGIQADSDILNTLYDIAQEKEVEVLTKVYWGDPREKLITAVEELKLDALVVGSRGLGMIKSLLLGSVSRHVVNHASCPVTVVKGSLPQND